MKNVYGSNIKAVVVSALFAGLFGCQGVNQQKAGLASSSSNRVSFNGTLAEKLLAGMKKVSFAHSVSPDKLELRGLNSTISCEDFGWMTRCDVSSPAVHDGTFDISFGDRVTTVNSREMSIQRQLYLVLQQTHTEGMPTVSAAFWSGYTLCGAEISTVHGTQCDDNSGEINAGEQGDGADGLVYSASISMPINVAAGN